MKWTMLLGGFMLYGILAIFGARYLMLWLSPTRSSYGEAVVWLLALVIGFVFGCVGMCSAYYMHRKEYVGAAAISLLLSFCVVIAMLSLLS